MATTSQPATFSELATDLANRIRSDTSVTTTFEIAKRYINIALHDVHVGSNERWPWTERQAILITHPRDTYDGNSAADGCSHAQGTAAFFFGTINTDTPTNGVGQGTIRDGGVIRVSGDVETYRLSGVTTGGFGDVATTDSVRSGATVAAWSAFEYWEDEYDLAADFLRPVDARRFSSGAYNISLIGRNQFRDLYPRNDTFGDPMTATIIDRSFDGNTTPVRRIRFHPVPDTAIRIQYSYVSKYLAVEAGGTEKVELENDTDEPKMPLHARRLLVLHALKEWYRDRNDDSQRAQDAKREFDEFIVRLRADTEVGQSRPQFRPQKLSYNRNARRPWRSGTGRFDLGRFDYGGE